MIQLRRVPLAIAILIFVKNSPLSTADENVEAASNPDVGSREEEAVQAKNTVEGTADYAGAPLEEKNRTDEGASSGLKTASAAAAASKISTADFIDCTTDFSEAAIKRAYRRAASRTHPDIARAHKGRENHSESSPEADGKILTSSAARANPDHAHADELHNKEDKAVVGDFAELRDSWLRDPMRFHIFRALTHTRRSRESVAEGDHDNNADSQEVSPRSTSEQLLSASTKSTAAGAAALKKTANTPKNMNTIIQAATVSVLYNIDQNDPEWPYVKVDLAVDNALGQIDGAAKWSFAFGRQEDHTTVHYKGDEAIGGYEMCHAGFIQNENHDAIEKNRTEKTQRTENYNYINEEDEARGPETTSTSGPGVDQLPSMLTPRESCVVPNAKPLHLSVRRPLHVAKAGRWGAALQIKDGENNVAACVAFAFRVDREYTMRKLDAQQQEDHDLNGASSSASTGESGLPKCSKGDEDNGRDANAGGPDGTTSSSCQNNSASEHETGQTSTQGAAGKEDANSRSRTSGSSSSTRSASRPSEPEPRFRFMKGGAFCEDGADILEGPLDNYGSNDPWRAMLFDESTKNSHFAAKPGTHSDSDLYGGNCRAKCLKRNRCRFYTIYSSGWCQLSTRCGKLRNTGDPLTATFAKELV